MSKAERATLEVLGIGAGGDGYAKYKSGQAYIPYTIDGDVVEVSLNPKGGKNWVGTGVKIITPSPHRVAPPCQHFTTCGGCSLQHLNADYYSKWIVERIQTALSHQGIENTAISAPILSPPASRRRIGLKAFNSGRNIVLGFNKRKSHQIVDLEACPVAMPQMVTLFAPLRTLLAKLLRQRQASEIQMLMLDGRMGMVISLPDDPDLRARELLAQFANEHDISSLSISVDGFEEPLASISPIYYGFNTGVKLAVPVSAFLQATHGGEVALQNAVMAAMAGKISAEGQVADLFSGLGTFSLILAQNYKTKAVEGELKLVKALEEGANKAQLLNLSHEHRDLFRRPLTVAELSEFEAVVFDPPRAGAEAQVSNLAQSTVPLIVGVSCNANTFGRDARTLIDGGYKLINIQPVDQFLWSHHVELVGVFER